MWHGQFGLLPLIKPDRPADVACMVARHGDAEMIGATLERFGMSLIRGAGAGVRRRDRGGAAALRESLTALERGTTVAMTADVPPGPARRAGECIATLAKLARRGDIGRDERVVAMVTGDGLKTIDAVRGTFEVTAIPASIDAFDERFAPVAV